MNVLFINPKTKDYSRSVTAPLGLLSIASVLQANGFSVRLYDRTVENVSLKSVLKSFQPDLVGVSLISFKSFFDARTVSEKIKELDIPVIWGGPLASELPDAVLRNRCVDAVSISEGEYTWLDLARAVQDGKTDFSQIKGMAVRAPDGSCIRTEIREFLDLGELPDIDWSLVSVEKYFQPYYGHQRTLYIYASKGCPYNCAFCFNKDFHRCKLRKRPMDAVLREIRFLAEHYGMDGVYFADELWFQNKQDLVEFCDSIRSLQLNIAWGCQTRVGLFDESDLKYMFDSGCRWMLFGIESGSKRMLAIINKRIDYDIIEQTIHNCTSVGIAAVGLFIIGFPGETEDDARQTVALIERLDTTLINLNHYFIVPGSDFYDQLIHDGSYEPITDLALLCKKDPMRYLRDNFSEIPSRDIKVIQSSYMWRSFRHGRSTDNGKIIPFGKKVVVDALRSLTRSSLKSLFNAVWSAGAEFLSYFFYSHAYPAIQKKYGIR